MPDITLKRGDTTPALDAQLFGSDGNPVDLTDAVRVRFIVVDAKGTKIIDSDAQVSSAPEGRVRYLWQQGDTDNVGNYRAEFEVTFADGRVGTYPNDRYLNIRILPDLG